MTVEIVTEKEVVKYAKRMGFLVRKVQFIGVVGAPDRWFFGRGYVFCIEFKKYKEGPRLRQLNEHNKLRDAGIPVYVVDTIEEGLDIVDSYSKLPIRELSLV